MSSPRPSFVTGVVVVLAVTFFAGLPPTAAQKAGKEAAPPPAEVLANLDLSGELQWYYLNDVGMLLLYAGERLHRLDLLDESAKTLEGLEFSGLAESRSVLPVARTGLLLVPTAPAGRGPSEAEGPGRSASSYAIDTLTGSVAWEAPPLPAADLLFSFPDVGLVVLRSPDDDGHLIAVNLLTGEKTWNLAIWARLIWIDAPYLRVVTQSALLTLDVQTGETVREDELALPASDRIHVYSNENVFVLWTNKNLAGFSVPPPPPADAAPPRKLWEFKAGGMMIGACIKSGTCHIRRIGEDRLLVASARHNEIVKLTTGERIVDLKRGMFSPPVDSSPENDFIACAAAEKMQILDGSSGELLHEIKYPEGSEGMKTLRYLSWLGNDRVMTVFPDKKGNPRKMSAFSCTDGSLAWATVLPEVADYHLTSEQRAKLILRITMSLVATAVSASNPMSVGGTNYFAVYAPNLDVGESLQAEGAPDRASEAGGAPPFARALERYAECDRLTSAEKGKSAYFVIGPEKRHDILGIDLVSGRAEPLARYSADRVHVIAPFSGFEKALTVENNNHRVRLIRVGSP